MAHPSSGRRHTLRIRANAEQLRVNRGCRRFDHPPVLASVQLNRSSVLYMNDGNTKLLAELLVFFVFVVSTKALTTKLKIHPVAAGSLARIFSGFNTQFPDTQSAGD